VATSAGESSVKIWLIANTKWNLIRNYTNHSDHVNCIEFVNEDQIVTGSSDGSIKIWSVRTGDTNRTIDAVNAVVALQLLSNGFYLAAGLTANINIYNLNDGSLVKVLMGHSHNVNDFVLINSSLLASSSADNTTRIWNLTTYTLKFILTGHTSVIRGLKLVSSDILASGSFDKTVKLWNITNGQLIRSLENHTNIIGWSLDMFNSQTLVSGSCDQTIKLWNICTGELLNTINAKLPVRALTVLNANVTISKRALFYFMYKQKFLVEMIKILKIISFVIFINIYTFDGSTKITCLMFGQKFFTI
jgi:WD40 repeat protein